MTDVADPTATDLWRTRARDGWVLLASLGATTSLVLLLALILNVMGDTRLFMVASGLGGLGYPIFGAWGALLAGSGAAQEKLGKIWLPVGLSAGLAGFVMCLIALWFAASASSAFREIGPPIFVLSVLAGLPPIAAGWAASGLGRYLRGRSSDAFSSVTAGVGIALVFTTLAAAISFSVVTMVSSKARERQTAARNAAVEVMRDDTAVGYYRYLSEHPQGPGSAMMEQRLYDLDPAFRDTERGRATSLLRESQP